MAKKPHIVTAIAAFMSLASMSSALFAADNSALWAALSAATTASGQSICKAHPDGYSDPCSPFAALMPLGAIVGAAILALFPSLNNGNGPGTGFEGAGAKPVGPG